MSPAEVSTASPRPIGAFSVDSRCTSGPPARAIAAATPPPCRSSVLAALVIASSSSLVTSACNTSNSIIGSLSRREVISLRRLLPDQDIQPPLARHAFEFALTALGERPPRSGDDVAHCRGHQHFARSRQRGHPRGDVHGHASDVGAAYFDLAGVNSHPHLDAEYPYRFDHRIRARDRRAGTRERRDKSVSGRVDFATAESVQLVADNGVVVVEQVSPTVVAERGCALSGADDVGEHDSGEYSLGVRPAAHACDELLDLVEYRRGVAHPVQRIFARQLHIA